MKFTQQIDKAPGFVFDGYAENAENKLSDL